MRHQCPPGLMGIRKNPPVAHSNPNSNSPIPLVFTPLAQPLGLSLAGAFGLCEGVWSFACPLAPSLRVRVLVLLQYKPGPQSTPTWETMSHRCGSHLRFRNLGRYGPRMACSDGSIAKYEIPRLGPLQPWRGCGNRQDHDGCHPSIRIRIGIGISRPRSTSAGPDWRDWAGAGPGPKPAEKGPKAPETLKGQCWRGPGASPTEGTHLGDARAAFVACSVRFSPTVGLCWLKSVQRGPCWCQSHTKPKGGRRRVALIAIRRGCFSLCKPPL